MVLKVTLNEQRAVLNLKRENQSGDCGFISYSSIVEALRVFGRIKPNEVVVGLEIDDNGIKYVLETVPGAPQQRQCGACLDTNVFDLEMTVRTTNLLLHHKIDNVAKVLEQGSKRLLMLPHFGRRQLQELTEVLEHHGYVLSEEGK